MMLFPDTELPKNHLQDILDINAPGQSAERAGGQAQFFRQDFLAVAVQRAEEGLTGFAQSLPVSVTGDQRRLADQIAGCLGQTRQQ